MEEKYGFVYIWYDRKHKRYYVGCRWGNINDGYICSSTWMKQGYKHRPQDFTRRIIETNIDNRQTLLDREAIWLGLIKKEELGKKYYNLTNRRFGHWSAIKEKYQSSVEKMKNTKKNTLDNMSAEERKLKYGKSRRGKPSTFKGKTHSPEARQKIKSKRALQVFSEETLEKKRKQIPWNKGMVKGKVNVSEDKSCWIRKRRIQQLGYK